MAAQTIDYAALARQAEQETSGSAAPKVDYAALARQAEAETNAPPSPAPQPTLKAYVPSAGNTISAAPAPSLWDRARGVVANSAIGRSIEEGLPKVADALNLHPTETVNSPTYQSDRQQIIAPQYLLPNPQSGLGHIARGALQGIGKMTSGNNLATTAAISATGGLAAPLAAGTGAAAAVGRVGAQGLKYAMLGQGAKGVYDSGKKAVSLYSAGDTPGAEEAIGEGLPNAAMMLPGAAQPLEKLGGASQTAGENLINETIGARSKDFARGASPGSGYFQAGFGPSASMRSIANKSGSALGSTGEAIGKSSANFEKGGGLIPYESGATPVLQGIRRLRTDLTGAGGTGDSSALDNYSDTWTPLLKDAQERGGFLPTEYAAAKRNTAKNTTWGDANQVGMKDLRQQTVGGMGGALVEQIPELAELNSKYQNLYKLNARATDRADTGSAPLTNLMTKGLYGAIGAGAGAASGHEILGPALGATATMALDSVPVRTSIASGLYYGGKALAATGRGLSNIPIPGLRGGVEEGAGYGNGAADNNSRDNSQSNFKQLRPPSRSSLYLPEPDYSQGGFPARENVVTPAPPARLRLPSQASSGESQPMVGVKGPQYPPLAESFAKERISPTQFAPLQSIPDRTFTSGPQGLYKQSPMLPEPVQTPTGLYGNELPNARLQQLMNAMRGTIKKKQ